MITTSNIPASQVTERTIHHLYIEGESADGFDVQVFREMISKWELSTRIDTSSLGVSSNVRAATEALFRINPRSYFIVDRDHFDDDYVNRMWTNFPNPETHNLLIWPRSELENYFLEPDLLARSSYLKPRFSKERIADEILRLFNTRIYFDIANLTILRLREKLKEKWIDLFRDPLPFKNQKDALGILLARQEFREKSRVTSTHLSKMFVSSLFTEICRDCFGGSTELKLEQGRWLELVNGKEAMRSVMNTCFSVRAEGVDIQGERKFTTIARDLVSSVPIAEQPADFRRLKELLTEKLK